MEWSIDFCFLIDIVVIFNSAFYDDDFAIVDNRSIISKKYLSGWFFIDVMTIIPFDTIF